MGLLLAVAGEATPPPDDIAPDELSLRKWVWQ
jgi:hypothetical protein